MEITKLNRKRLIDINSRLRKRHGLSRANPWLDGRKKEIITINPRLLILEILQTGRYRFTRVIGYEAAL